ncbi:hypothetical protein [Streptomyces sp. NPDC058307]|uniref:hypothetical protein n=1 Tax=Streptomyces sp. NPDC058307 TaxID=3346439 RepID=UPI0036F119B0
MREQGGDGTFQCSPSPATKRSHRVCSESAAVEREDSAVVAEELGLDAEALYTVLPALSSWRRRERQRRKVQRWRYRVDWKPLPNSRAQESLQGGWLLVVPQGRCPCRKPHPA